jgi:hypothetical protein
MDAESFLTAAGLPDKARGDFPRVVNRLVGQSFVYQDVEADKEDYYFIHRYQPTIEAALGLAGFELRHDDYHRIFQVTSHYGYARAHYHLDESLMIVVLRKLYEERVEHLSLAADPVVTVAEVREEYRTLTGRERDLGIVQYETLLRRLRGLGLLDAVDGRAIDVRDGGARLRLRGSVRLILPVQSADEMEAWLRKYRPAGGDEARTDQSEAEG